MPTSAFIRYCRTLGGSDAERAKVCMRVGGRTPTECEQRVKRAFDSGAIDRASYEYQLDAVSSVSAMYSQRDRFFDLLGASDHGWDDLGDGCRMRRDVVYDSNL